MPGLENLQIMPTSGEPPTPAVQAQQHRLEHALEDELVDGAGDAGEAARHAGALDRVGVGRAPLERLGLEPGLVRHHLSSSSPIRRRLTALMPSMRPMR